MPAARNLFLRTKYIVDTLGRDILTAQTSYQMALCVLQRR